jgi:serine/threonine protein phosphatase PrpC
MNGAIYRYFGLGEKLEIDIDKFTMGEFDRILILSDGVTKVFHPIEAADKVEEYDDIYRGARELARLSQTRGSTDDITVLLVEKQE